VTEARDIVESWFGAQTDLHVERLGDNGWLTVLAGERKRTIPVYLELGDQTLALQSFFVRAVDEAAADVYALLLRRHQRSYVLRFALDDDGDILIVAVLPLRSLTSEELDRVLGQLLVLADETFDSVLRRGFASYIAVEQAWRVKVGLGRNPIT
jgi:hypothetical protein